MSCKPKPDARPYRRKPKDVTAFRWDGEEVEGFSRVFAGYDNDGNPAYSLVVAPLSGPPAFARPGDPIVTIDGVDTLVSPDEFDRDYEPR